MTSKIEKMDNLAGPSTTSKETMASASAATFALLPSVISSSSLFSRHREEKEAVQGEAGNMDNSMDKGKVDHSFLQPLARVSNSIISVNSSQGRLGTRTVSVTNELNARQPSTRSL